MSCVLETAIVVSGIDQLSFQGSGSLSLGQFRASPAVGPEGVVYLGCLDNKLYAVNPSGTLKWSYLTGGQIYSTPGFGADGTVYFAARDNKVYALDPGTGSLRTGWPKTASGVGDSSPAIAPDGSIYVGGASYVYAFLASGQTKSGWPQGVGGTVYSSPAIDREGTVFVGCQDGKLYAFNPDGTRKWNPPFNAGYGIRSSPALDAEGNVFFGTDSGVVYAVSPNGSLLWTRSAGYFIDSSPAVDARGYVIIGSWNGKVYSLRPSDGGIEWEFLTGGLIQSPPAITTDGTVYIGNGDGHLYALSNPAGLARSDWPMFHQNARHTGNPASLRLASPVRLGNEDFQFQIQGLKGLVCEVEASHNLTSWDQIGTATLTTGSATFTDWTASHYAYRFYRVRSGGILSYNALGYMEVPAPTGFSMIANQLDNPAGNTVAVLLLSPPQNTVLSKWNETTQEYDTTTFSGGGWSDPAMTLNPGEGAWIQPGSATTLAFVGQVRQDNLANPFPSGMSIRSSMVPQWGPIDLLLGFAPLDGDAIDLYVNEEGQYEVYTFDFGEWAPGAPQPWVGESFWISSAAPRTWARRFTVWP